MYLYNFIYTQYYTSVLYGLWGRAVFDLILREFSALTIKQNRNSGNIDLWVHRNTSGSLSYGGHVNTNITSMERFYPAFAWLCMHLRHAPWEFWCDDKIRRRTTNSTMSWKSWKISFDKRLFSLVRRAWIVMSLSGCTNCDWKKPEAGSGNWCGEGLKQQRGSSPRVCLHAIVGTLKFRFWLWFYVVNFF
jgi:hypothetical protein